MKFDHEGDYFYKYEGEIFTVQHNFTNEMASGETLNTCTASIYDSEGTDKTASMISSVSVSSPSVTFKVSSGDSGETYEVKLAGVADTGHTYINKKVCEVFAAMEVISKLADPAANSYVTLKEANDYMRNVRSHPSAWDITSIEGKKRLLIEACQDIDKFNFIGEKYYDNQALQFPRNDHKVITGNCATPLTSTGFKHTDFSADTYGSRRYNTNYWKYGTIHITAATPLDDIRNISANNTTTDVVTVGSEFSATPTTNTEFIAFEPLDINIKDAQCEQALFLLENVGDTTLQRYRDLGADEVEIGDVRVSFKDATVRRVALSSDARKLISPWIERYRKVLRQ